MEVIARFLITKILTPPDFFRGQGLRMAALRPLAELHPILQEISD
jgi:hypothetical protein